MKKKFLSLFLALVFALGTSTAAFAAADASGASTAAYLTQAVQAPVVASSGGDWAVLAVARGGYAAPDGWYAAYLDNVQKTLKAQDGVLSTRKYTEYSRVILGLTAIGADPTDVAGYDLTLPLGDFEATILQGINGASFALIALDSADYEIPQNPEAETQATRELYVQEILRRQLESGGFALGGDTADPDITAMALQALSRYAGQAEVAEAIQRGLACLSELQNSSGGFSSRGVPNAESCAQVIIALSTLGISLDDPRFVKNGNTVLDGLLAYQLSDGSFCHMDSGESDLMATEQALLALAALQREESGQSALYDMREKTFPDIQGHENQAAIEALAAANIINGMGDGSFAPDKTMTRAEYAAVMVRGLALPLSGRTGTFLDVAAGKWYSAYIQTAYENGLIRGRTDTEFDPDGTITTVEAEIMLYRAAVLCGLDAGEEPAWEATDSLIKRCEIAQSLYDLLLEAGRI